MKVSINEIKRLGYDEIVDISVDELVTKIGAQLGAVEDVEDLGAKYQGVVVARVVSCENHPDADRLHVCKLDDGGVIEGMDRDENGHVQVVCGAPNVHEGMLVAWLPPNSTVPETYHHEAPFVLGARELRGVVSNGMLASPKELALGDSHEGILEIDVDAQPGQPFAEVYHLNDHIIDIENKMFTHRPDCFGLLGVAREIAGIQHIPFASPEWYRTEPTFDDQKGLKVAIHNDIRELVPRFMTVAMSGITVSPSPMWLQTALLRLGVRPISNVVDITNYLMLVTGQPLHAYDYDKVGGTLGTRLAKAGEKLMLLGGKEIELSDQDIVITDGNRPIGLAGIMGGKDTEVSDETKTILIEVANFDMYAIRRASMRHGLFTDASTRFTKGQSPLQNDRVLAKAIDFLKELAGGQVASHVEESRRIEDDVHTVSTSSGFINDRLGLKLSAEDMATLLRNVEFDVKVSDNYLVVTAPFWRTDIEIAEDVVEEVGRLYGFDSLPLVLPTRSITPTAKNPAVSLKQAVRHSLARSGANEVLTYSFVHEKLLSKAGQDKSDAFQLSNALSPDLHYFRLSLMPSLLDKVHANVRGGYDEFALFEIGKAHNARLHLDDDKGLPKEPGLIDLVYAGTAKSDLRGSAFYKVRRLLDRLADDLGLELDYAPHDGSDDNFPITKPFDLSRSAYVTVKGTDIFLGLVGEFKSDVAANFKLPKHAAGFTLGVEELLEATKGMKNDYRILSRFPGTSQDVCFRVDEKLSYGELEATVHGALEKEAIETSHEAIDIYQADDSDSKQVTFRISMTDHARTITGDQANQVIKNVIDAAVTAHNAVVV